MRARWELSLRELGAWVTVILLAAVSVWLLRPGLSGQVPVRVVRPESCGTVTDSPVRLDLNRATEAELQLLPGIGASRARQIVEFRRQRAFRTVEELTGLPGFSKALVARLEPLLTVGPAASDKR